MKEQLAGKIASVKVTTQLSSQPCENEMAVTRHYVRTHSEALPEKNHFALLQPQLQINSKHTSKHKTKKRHELRTSNADLAALVTKQLSATVMLCGDLVEDPRILLTNMNELQRLWQSFSSI